MNDNITDEKLQLTENNIQSNICKKVVFMQGDFIYFWSVGEIYNKY